MSCWYIEIVPLSRSIRHIFPLSWLEATKEHSEKCSDLSLSAEAYLELSQQKMHQTSPSPSSSSSSFSLLQREAMVFNYITETQTQTFDSDLSLKTSSLFLHHQANLDFVSLIFKNFFPFMKIPTFTPTSIFHSMCISLTSFLPAECLRMVLPKETISFPSHQLSSAYCSSFDYFLYMNDPYVFHEDDHEHLSMKHINDAFMFSFLARKIDAVSMHLRLPSTMTSAPIISFSSSLISSLLQTYTSLSQLYESFHHSYTQYFLQIPLLLRHSSTSSSLEDTRLLYISFIPFSEYYLLFLVFVSALVLSLFFMLTSTSSFLISFGAYVLLPFILLLSYLSLVSFFTSMYMFVMSIPCIIFIITIFA